MDRNSIVARLLNQGHITMKWADIILNNKERIVEVISDLHTDGNINTKEAISLLKENDLVIPAPSITYPTFPYNPAPGIQYPQWQEHHTNPPNTWCSTTSTTGEADLNKNYTEK